MAWDSGGISPGSVPQHADYIDNLSKEVEYLMKEKIADAIHKKIKSDVSDPLYDEVVEHLLFCQTKCSTFYGRKEILHRCSGYLEVPVLVLFPKCVFIKAYAMELET